VTTNREVAARRTKGFGTSIFSEITALANAHGAVNLGQGFPDFEAPAFVKEAARRHIAEDRNQYAASPGLPRLRQELVADWRRRHGDVVAPYDPDGEVTVGDSDAIIEYLRRRYRLPIDGGLSDGQRNLDLLVRRTLDDLYWQMSWSRWGDDRFWPAFRDALLSAHPAIAAASLEAAREYNRLRYRYQGIGRYEPAQVYERGIANLRVVADLIGTTGFVFGSEPSSIDAAIYGFVANIHFYDIETPLKRYVKSRPQLVRHCLDMHGRTAQRRPPVQAHGPGAAQGAPP